MPTPQPIPVETAGGIYLPGADLWLDPHRKQDFAFVSHAHADHFARHATILCSPNTAALIRARYGGAREYIELDFGEGLEREGHRIELVPAGHTLGSAMIHITRQTDGASLLYTGDFKTRPGLSAEPPGLKGADTLIMETTFGLPKYIFPPAEEVRAATLRFCREALAAGAVPVLLGYSFGKAQEIMAMLAGGGLEVSVHDKVAELLPVYRAAGVEFPEHRPIDPASIAGKVLVMPPGARRPPAPEGSAGFRVAMFSGWGIDPSARYRYRCDEVFPLSDHADYRDSLRFVDDVSPRRVLTTHGYAAEFAADLRHRGYEAWSLRGDDQLEFGGDGFGRGGVEIEP